MDADTRNAVLHRLRRKIEVMHLEFKAQQNHRYHDLAEMLKLVEMLEKDGA